MASDLEATIRAPVPEELERHGLAVVEAGGREILVLKEGGAYRAVDRWCPHEGGDLSEGLMIGRNIKCPLHGHIYDLQRGRCLNTAGHSARVYTVELADGELVLRPVSEPTNRSSTNA
ncbi:MAG: Rieske 2Fe-2S domain-containing protein [Dehalococcoidia bacterium]